MGGGESRVTKGLGIADGMSMGSLEADCYTDIGHDLNRFVGANRSSANCRRLFCQIEDVDGFGIRPLKLGDKKAFRSHGLSGT
jgi:hypothetical protein